MQYSLSLCVWVHIYLFLVRAENFSAPPSLSFLHLRINILRFLEIADVVYSAWISNLNRLIINLSLQSSRVLCPVDVVWCLRNISSIEVKCQFICQVEPVTTGNHFIWLTLRNVQQSKALVKDKWNQNKRIKFFCFTMQYAPYVFC